MIIAGAVLRLLLYSSIHKATAATHEVCHSEEECELSSLELILLQLDAEPFVLVKPDQVAMIEKLNESSMGKHSSRVEVRSSISDFFNQRILYKSSPKLTACLSLFILAIIIALLLQAPGIISHLLQSRQAAAEAIVSPSDPLEVHSTVESESARDGTMLVVRWAVTVILVSMSVIRYNKFLMTEGHFPYAVNLTLLHQVSGSIFTFIMYQIKPRLFKSLQGSTSREVALSRKTLLGGFLPVAICSAGQLVLSNCALTFASVAFLQMMKEGNVALVYILSLLAGLEIFHCLRLQVLFGLLCATGLTIQGELEFSAKAVLVQGTSQMLEATKIVLQGLLMSAAGSKHLDPYTFNLICQPTVATLLFAFLICCVTFLTDVPIASFVEIIQWAPHLVVSCCMVFILNISIANFFAVASPVSYVIIGPLKDIFIIIVDVIFSGTTMSSLQVKAFALQLFFAASYSFLKLNQERLDSKADPDSEK
jgi:hypothetical protein